MIRDNTPLLEIGQEKFSNSGVDGGEGVRANLSFDVTKLMP